MIVEHSEITNANSMKPLTNEKIDTIEFADMLDEAKKHTDENGLIGNWGYRMPLERKAK